MTFPTPAWQALAAEPVRYRMCETADGFASGPEVRRTRQCRRAGS